MVFMGPWSLDRGAGVHFATSDYIIWEQSGIIGLHLKRVISFLSLAHWAPPRVGRMNPKLSQTTAQSSRTRLLPCEAFLIHNGMAQTEAFLIHNGMAQTLNPKLSMA